MKKIIAIVVFAAVLIGGAAYALTGNLFFNQETDGANQQSFRQTAENAAQNASNPLAQAIDSRGISAEVTGEAARIYALIAEQNPTEAELSYLTGLLQKDYDMNWVAEIYEFWLTCGEDIPIIEQIYLASETQQIDGRYWVEETYNSVTNNAHGVLDSIAIGNYIESGLTVADIERANILSRKGTYTINQILDNILGGSTWAEVVNSVYQQQVVPDNTLAIDVAGLARLSKRANGVSLIQAVETAYSFEEEGTSVVQRVYGEQAALTAANAVYTDETSKIITAYGVEAGQVLSMQPEEMQDSFSSYVASAEAESAIAANQQAIAQALAEKGITGTDQLDFSETEVYNAALIAEEENLTVSEVLAQYRSSGRWSKRINKGVYLG